MPDLMSHLLIGLILAELLNTKKKSLVVLGALMPDLISKIHLVYFYFGFPHSISFYNFPTPFIAFFFMMGCSITCQYGTHYIKFFVQGNACGCNALTFAPFPGKLDNGVYGKSCGKDID